MPDPLNFPLIRELRSGAQAHHDLAAQLRQDHPNLNALLTPIVNRDAQTIQDCTDWLNGPHEADPAYRLIEEHL